MQVQEAGTRRRDGVPTAPQHMKIQIGRSIVSTLLILAGVTLLGFAARERDQVFLNRKADGIASTKNQPAINVSGEAARAYLQETADGQSLLEVVTAVQFGLQAQEHSPSDEQSGPGHLGMSHDQNLNAWFSEDGVTVRPTVSKEEREQVWQLGFRLKALGYGSELADAPPVVRQTVEGNRIQYHRSHDRPFRGSRVGCNVWRFARDTPAATTRSLSNIDRVVCESSRRNRAGLYAA